MPYDPTDLQKAITEIVELSWRRTHIISIVNKQTNATKALARRFAGWRADLPEKQRTAIAKQVGRIIEAGVENKPQAEGDAHLASLLAVEIEALSLSVGHVEKMRKDIEKRMQKLARTLPGYAFAKQVKGFGDLGFAVIVGMAGDLSRYDDRKKLLKRLGLTPYTRADGETRAGSTWAMNGGLTKEDWIAAGYNKRRLGDVYGCITASLFRAQWSSGKNDDGVGRPTGRYGVYYARRRVHTSGTHPEWSKGQSQKDALRIMTGRLVMDLWMAWRCDVDGRAQPYLRFHNETSDMLDRFKPGQIETEAVHAAP